MKYLSIVLITALIVLSGNGISYATCNLSGFTTYTQGGWGSPSNSTPGGIRDAHFTQVFPSGMVMGGTFKAKFTSATAIKDFLPQGGTADAFDQNYIDPSSTSAGVFGGQLAALMLNVKYSDAGYLGNTQYKLGQLIIVSGPLAGKSVYQLLDLANIAIGGGSTSFSINDLKTAADNINNNFDNGNQDQGFLTCPVVTPASVGDFVWLDADHNGIQDAGEAGVTNVSVKLYDKNNVLIGSTTTNASGKYSFTNLTPNVNYYISFTLPSGYAFSPKNAGADSTKDSDADVTTGKTAIFSLSSGENNLSKDAGIYLPAASLGDKVWNDVNQNGIQDAGENGVANVTVNLFDKNNSFIGTTVTNSNGIYSFTNLTPNVVYYVQFVLPSGYAYSPKNAGSDSTKDSDADLNGKTSLFSLAPAEVNLSKDAGIYLPYASLGDFVWNDANHNGIQDAGEPGIPNVTVKLYNSSNVLVSSTVTSPSGYYSFTNLTPGVNFYIQVIKPSGYSVSPKNAGTDSTKDSDIDAAGKSSLFVLAPGENNLSKDAGLYVPTACVGDLVFNDANNNGIQDAGEPGISGVTVKMFDKFNVLVASTTTNNTGNYSFCDLTPGTNLYIQFIAPSGYVYSPKNAGSDSTKDSDADVNGKTNLFVLAPGENNLSKDAGLYLPTASVGDYVWNDANHNGIQDASETGVANVIVKLYDANNNLIATMPTNSQGYYLFAYLTPGTSYYVKFELPSGYVFSPKDAGSDDLKDSDADLNGKTDVFTLAAGENNLSFDAGIFVPAPETTPVLHLTKTDGILFMKPLGDSDTYTIRYRNSGTGDLLNASIVDTLPAGLTYVSCSGAISCAEVNSGSNIIRFDLGTVAAGDSGFVTVTASVTAVENNYTNYVYFSGVDGNGAYYWVNALDVDLVDTTSGGGEGGVESKGDLAELLFERQLKIRYGLTTPMLSDNGGPSGITSAHTLQEIIPSAGPFTSTATEVTPFDILGISNAIAAYAVDYKVPVNNVGKTVAAVFSTITTAPYIYDHSKAVCDRLAGSQIQELKLIGINGHNFYAAKLYNAEKDAYDYAISFSVYETASGYKVENKWTYNEYNAPSNASFVYNFQVWSAAYPSTVELVKNVLAKFSTYGSLSYMNNAQANPEVYAGSITYKHTGKVTVDVTNTTDAPKDVTFTISYRVSQGADQLTTVKNYSVEPGRTLIEINLGVIADAGLKLSMTTGFKDETYISGGSYGKLSGPQSNVSQFITNIYPQQVNTNYPTGSVVLAGGAKLAGTVNDWVSVMRSLTPGGTAYNLSGYDKIRFTANGTGVLTVLVDQTTTVGYNYHAYDVTLNGSDQVYEINLNSFMELWGTNHTPIDPSKIRMIAFQFQKAKNPNITNFAYEVKNIAFIPSGVTAVNNENTLPTEFSLSQNYPNPFNPTTVIEFSVAKKEMLNLTVYNILGERVMTLLSGEMEVGIHRVNFDASRLASGVYIYNLKGSSINVSKKMILTK